MRQVQFDVGATLLRNADVLNPDSSGNSESQTLNPKAVSSTPNPQPKDSLCHWETSLVLSREWGNGSL